MADRIIDYDRGALIKTHPGTGMDVFMYVDDPGKYLNAHGHAVPETIAQESGYDVEKLGKEKLRLERKKNAAALIDAELADDKDLTENVVAEIDGWQLISLGLGRHNVVDPDGNILNKNHLSVEMGQKLLASFTAKEEAVKSEPKPGKIK